MKGQKKVPDDQQRRSTVSLLVTGSIGIDTVESPWGRVEDALGGSGVYFACAASLFSPVRLVGVVGEDCPDGFLTPLHDNPNIDMSGLEVRPGAKTFRWHGRYREDVNLRDTVSVELNVLAGRSPEIPEHFRDSELVFLANTHPALQIGLIEQLTHPRLVVADSMDLWIRDERDALMELICRTEGFVLNDSEARQLAGKPGTIEAGAQIVQRVAGGRGDGFLIVKKGEHGSLLFADKQIVALPSYPARRVVDPTGAGDSFAGGLMGYLACCGMPWQTRLRRAIAYGTVTASFALEDFSLGRLRGIDRGDIDARLAEFEAMFRF